MNQEHDDKDLERYLDGGSAESHRYAQLGEELPPPEIDARILAEAERAVKVTPLSTRRAPPFKAFAWAAVVVLSFSLVLNVLFQQAVQDPVATLEEAAGRMDAPAPVASPAESKDSKIAPSVGKAELSEQSNDTIAAARKSAAPPDRERPVTQSLSDRQRNAVDVAEAEGDSASISDELLRLAEPGVASNAAPESDYAAGRAANVTGDKSRRRVPAMQIVADFLALPAGAEREETPASAAPTDSDADAELQRILDLYDAGHRDDAMADLAAFREEYPAHPVSVSLEVSGF